MAEEKNIDHAGNEENRKIKMNFGGMDIEATVDKDGRIIMPQEVQQFMTAGMAVMQKTEKGADAADVKAKGTDEVTEKFRGLPMRDLIGAPLVAAAEAQEKLASTACDYYQRIADEK